MYLVGQKTIEVFKNDGVTPFIRYAGGVINIGTSAKYSVVKVEDETADLIMLDKHRRIVAIQNNQVSDIAPTLSHELNRLSFVADAEGLIMNVDGLPIYVLNLPTERVSYAVNLLTGFWSAWTKFDSTYSTNTVFEARAVVRAIGFGKTYIGLRDLDTLNEFSLDHFDDNGSVIDKTIEFPVITHGTAKRKISKRLQIRLHRGGGPVHTTRTPTALLSWRDDGKSYISIPREIDLGLLGDTDIIVSIPLLGSYVSRQYRIICRENVEFILVGAVESINVLEAEI